MYGLPNPGMAPSPFGIQEPAFPPVGIPYHGNISPYDLNWMDPNPFAPIASDIAPHNINATTTNLSSLPPNNSQSPLPLNPNNRFTCPTCNKTYARRGDLRRHELKHNPSTKKIDCPKPGCVRKGNQGFERKDKMVDHLKVCKGGARGKYRDE